MRDLVRREFLGQTIALGAVATVGSAALVAPAHANTLTKV